MGRSLYFDQENETGTVSHTLLQDPKLYHLLYIIDQEIAAAEQANGCHCGGKLHSARYPRKPRGLSGLANSDTSRFSFCCARCRRRKTPASVRYLGRRVYLAMVVVLVSAMQCGVTDRRANQLNQWIVVPRRTLDRWRQWWQTEFVQTPFWRWAKGQVLPPVDEHALPASLLARFGDACEEAALVPLLRFISPLTRPSGSTLFAGP